jgi:hypothetical protein
MTTTTTQNAAALREQLHTTRLLLADALQEVGLTTARLAAARRGNWPSRTYANDATFAADDARRLALHVALLESQLQRVYDASSSFAVAA